MNEQITDPVGDAITHRLAGRAGARIIDIGGGSGARAVPLAQAGFAVLVVDASTDALASLERRAAEAGVSDRIDALQADADQLDSVLEPSSADMVLYHHVIQEVDDPARSLASATELVRPGGTLSILVPGRLSAVLSEALVGRYRQAEEILVAESASDGRYDVPALRAAMERAGLTVDSITGVSVVMALASSRVLAADEPELASLETRLREHPVLGQVAGDLHGLGIRPAR